MTTEVHRDYQQSAAGLADVRLVLNTTEGEIAINRKFPRGTFGVVDEQGAKPLVHVFTWVESSLARKIKKEPAVPMSHYGRSLLHSMFKGWSNGE